MEGGTKHDLLCLDNSALGTSKDVGKQGEDMEDEIKVEESSHETEGEDGRKANADG